MEELFNIRFDMDNAEIEKAYIRFQNKFTLKKKLIYTVVYIIVIILGIDLILKNPTSPFGYIAAGLGAGILLFNWIQPVMIRKKMLSILGDMGQETYIMSFFEDRIEIATEIAPEQETEIVAITSHGVMPVEEGSEAAKEIAADPGMVRDDTKIEKSVYRLAENELTFYEDESLFHLYLNRSSFYAIPKRCLDEAALAALKEYISDKALGA